MAKRSGNSSAEDRYVFVRRSLCSFPQSYNPIEPILDHSAVFVQIACNCSPVALLILHHMPFHPPASTFLESFPINASYSSLFVFTNMVVLWLYCFFGVWHVHNRRAQRMLYWIFMVVLTIPSFPILSVYMTLLERSYFLFVLVLNFVGAMIFGQKVKTPFANFFGYHEIFHVFTILAALTLYRLVYSLNMNAIEERCFLQSQISSNHLFLSSFMDVMAVTITTRNDICTSLP